MVNVCGMKCGNILLFILCFLSGRGICWFVYCCWWDRYVFCWWCVYFGGFVLNREFRCFFFCYLIFDM